MRPINIILYLINYSKYGSSKKNSYVYLLQIVQYFYTSVLHDDVCVVGIQVYCCLRFIVVYIFTKRFNRIINNIHAHSVVKYYFFFFFENFYSKNFRSNVQNVHCLNHFVSEKPASDISNWFQTMTYIIFLFYRSFQPFLCTDQWILNEYSPRYVTFAAYIRHGHIYMYTRVRRSKFIVVIRHITEFIVL